MRNMNLESNLGYPAYVILEWQLERERLSRGRARGEKI